MAETIQLLDVSTGQMVTKDRDPNLDWSINGDQWKWGTMPDGSTVKIDTTIENWRDYGGEQLHEDGLEWTYGYQEPDRATPPPSWDDGLQGNLGNPVNPDPILTPEPGGGTGPGGNTRIDLPQPEGGDIIPWTGEGPQADTSWDWDAFVPKRQGDAAWGGYDTDYQAFERYQPGMDSPWGMSNLEGGNEDFYQQQFVNMLRDEQGFQSRERDAQARRQDAQENPFEAGPTDWSWANSGLGLADVNVGTGDVQSTAFSFNPTYEGMTNEEAWNSMKGLSAFDDRDLQKYMGNYFDREGNEDVGSSTSWFDSFSPTSAFNAIDPTSWEGMNHAGQVQGGINQALRNIYTGNQQGPRAPVGYASPIGSY